LVLLVLDNSVADNDIDSSFLIKITGRKTITVLHKSDLPARFDVGRLPGLLTDTVRISAKFGDGIEDLLQKIKKVLGVDGFDLRQAVCFTARQEMLMGKLAGAESQAEAVSLITELLNGPVRV